MRPPDAVRDGGGGVGCISSQIQQGAVSYADKLTQTIIV
jgi:hypothetical protein